MNSATHASSKNSFFHFPAYEPGRPQSKTPISGQFTRNATMQSTLNNMQSLQSIKNQIQHLQNTLTSSHKRPAKYSHDAPEIVKEKSFYNLIREQLKQVNQLQSSSSQHEQLRMKDSQQHSKSSTPVGSVPKNHSVLIDNPSSKMNALKSLLNYSNRPQAIAASQLIEKQQHDEASRQQLQIRLKLLEEQKLQKLIHLKERFRNEKRLIEEEHNKQMQHELQLYELQLKKNIVKSGKQHHQIKTENLQYSSASSSSSSPQMKTSYHLTKQTYRTPNDKSLLVSSLKKDNSWVREKKLKVRFEQDPGQRFKTDEDGNRSNI